jgi:hypothetical protein
MLQRKVASVRTEKKKRQENNSKRLLDKWVTRIRLWPYVMEGEGARESSVLASLELCVLLSEGLAYYLVSDEGRYCVCGQLTCLVGCLSRDLFN